MRVGIVQLAGTAEPGDERALADTRTRSVEQLCAVFDQGADLAVLPECALHRYVLDRPEDVRALAETVPGPTVEAWQGVSAARGGYVVGGILERDGDRFYNTAVVVGPEGLIGRYRKMHRFGWEQNWLEAGEGLILVTLRAFDVRLGVLVCYDLRFPEAVRALAFQGMDILAAPTTWTSIGKRTLWDAAGYCLQDHVAIAHAYQNHVAVVCADRIGREGSVRFLGASIGVSPGGDVAVGPLPRDEESLAVADMDLSSARQKTVGGAGNLWRDRRASYPVTEIEA
jgi:predicted amidohydrolase